MRLGTTTQSDTRRSTRGFAVILNESDFRELELFHSAVQRLDYLTYLARLWRRILLVGQAGHRVLVAPFLIDQHISYADRIGAPPFSALALRAFDTFVTQTCPNTREWLGEPIDSVIANLRVADGMTAVSRAPGRTRRASAATALRCIAARAGSVTQVQRLLPNDIRTAV